MLRNLWQNGRRKVSLKRDTEFFSFGSSVDIFPSACALCCGRSEFCLRALVLKIAGTRSSGFERPRFFIYHFMSLLLQFRFNNPCCGSGIILFCIIFGPEKHLKT